MAADQVITALLGAFDAQPSERAASQEALQGWEGMPGYVPLLLQLYAAPPPPRWQNVASATHSQAAPRQC